MTAPEQRSREFGWVLRAILLAAVVAELIAGILCLSGLTPARVAVGLIAGAVTGAVLIFL